MFFPAPSRKGDIGGRRVWGRRRVKIIAWGEIGEWPLFRLEGMELFSNTILIFIINFSLHVEECNLLWMLFSVSVQTYTKLSILRPVLEMPYISLPTKNYFFRKKKTPMLAIFSLNCAFQFWFYCVTLGEGLHLKNIQISFYLSCHLILFHTSRNSFLFFMFFHRWNNFKLSWA